MINTRIIFAFSYEFLLCASVRKTIYQILKRRRRGCEHNTEGNLYCTHTHRDYDISCVLVSFHITKTVQITTNAINGGKKAPGAEVLRVPQ